MSLNRPRFHWRWGQGGGRLDRFHCRAGFRAKMLADERQLRSLPGTHKAIVTHLDEAPGQHMLQEAMDELLDGERAEFGLAGVGGPIPKGDPLILDLHQAPIAQGHAKHIRSQILEGRLAVAHGLAVNHPVGCPHLRRDLVEDLRGA